MANWPATIIAPWLTFVEDAFNPIIVTEFEAGYTQTRPRFTRAKKRFILKWELMSIDQVDILRPFYDSMAGGAVFTWTHPVSGTPYVVRFTKDELICTRLSAAWWVVDVELEEV
jgi:hypothetical protein